MAYSLSGERPTSAALPFSPLGALRRVLARALAAQRRKAALNSLMEMDDFRLKDLGLTRTDLALALATPDYRIEAVRDRTGTPHGRPRH